MPNVPEPHPEPPPDEPKPRVDVVEHETRYRTLLSIARQYREHPERFGIVKVWRPKSLIEETVAAEGDESRGGCTRRSTEQGDKGFVLGGDQFGAELQYATSLLIGLDDLDPLPGHRFAPIGSSGLRKKLAKSRELMRRALQDLTNQVLGQCDIVSRHFQQRNDVSGRNRPDKVG